MAIALLQVSCSCPSPQRTISIEDANVVWTGVSADRAVAAYLLREYYGGAAGDTNYTVALSPRGQVEAKIVLESRAKMLPIQAVWRGNALHVLYSDQTIWNFSNVFVTPAATYNIVLDKVTAEVAPDTADVGSASAQVH